MLGGGPEGGGSIPGGGPAGGGRIPGGGPAGGGKSADVLDPAGLPESHASALLHTYSLNECHLCSCEERYWRCTSHLSMSMLETCHADLCRQQRLKQVG